MLKLELKQRREPLGCTQDWKSCSLPESCDARKSRTSNPGYGLSLLQQRSHRSDNTFAVIRVSAVSVVAGARNHECYTVQDIFWIDLMP